MVKDYIIGLDLGINNVGYAIIDESANKIVKKGVRLYNQANSAEERRVSRNTRRRIKRQKNRINESLILLDAIGFPNQNTSDSLLVEKRLKGLKEKLEKQEIVNIVCYYMAHRGYIPFGDNERELINLQGMYPCVYYKGIWGENGKYRALEQVVNHEDLKNEFADFLNKQSTFYPELKEIIGSIEEEKGLLWIFSRKRKFWEGPGSINYKTPYGRFKTDTDVLAYNELKKQRHEKYLFEDLIGHCKIYREEKCVPKANFLAEKFNLLNDFLNIRIIRPENILKESYIFLNDKDSDYKLTTEALSKIVDYCINFEGKSLSYSKVLKEVLGLKKDDILGYRVGKNGEVEFSLMKAYRYIIRLFKENNLSINWLIQDDYKNYNKLINILAVAPGIVEIEKMLTNIHFCNETEKKIIKEIQAKIKKDGFLQYHSLSEKALNRAINDMLSTCQNFMQVSKKFDYDKEAREYFLKNYGSGEGKLLMTTKYVDELIASPQVKKTLKQSIKIINAIIREMGTYPSIIAIESTKEMNSDEKKKAIEQDQKRNENRHKEAKKVLEEIYSDDKITENMIERIKLYLEVNRECPYCGKNININDVINNTVEIEHILPISQSADDSQDNKTISCRNCNSKKLNKTPYGFLSMTEFEEFENRILKYNISDKKVKNFTTKEDVNKYKQRFFNRNLRDTAYATKELVNQVHLFNNYLKANIKDIEIKTLSTPGMLTNNIRSNWNLEKNRDEGKYHHVVDASIVAGIATTKLGKLIIEEQNDSKFWILKKEVADKIPEYLKNFNLKEWKNDISQIKSDRDIQISKQVNKDPNRSLANANIASFIKKDDDYYIINQIDDIYSPDLLRKEKEKLNVLFDENNKKFTLLCQEKDPKLFYYLKEIYEKYQSDKINPFRAYCEDTMPENASFDYFKYGIKTPSKNGKGVLVKKLRYYSSANEPYLLEKKNINKKENTYIGLDNVSIYCTRLYWDKDKKKIIFMPIYCPCVNFKTKKINKEHTLYQHYYQKFIQGKNVEFIVDLFNGNYLEIEKPNGEIIFKFVESYHKVGKKISCKDGNYLASKDKFTLYDVDILGNKKKRLTWPNNSDIM